MPKKKSTQLVTRTPSPGRGGAARVAVTPAGLVVIERSAAEGNDYRTIAKFLGIDGTTLLDLRERDPEVALVWERGHAALADEVTHHLLRAARKGNIVAAIFLAKARLGWREGTAAEGVRQEVRVSISIPPPMSDAEFKAIIEGRASAAPQLKKETVING